MSLWSDHNLDNNSVSYINTISVEVLLILPLFLYFINTIFIISVNKILNRIKYLGIFVIFTI